MGMPMMGIREMGVAVGNRCVPVRVRMARARLNRGFVLMVVMFVSETVPMFVAVLERLMGM